MSKPLEHPDYAFYWTLIFPDGTQITRCKLSRSLKFGDFFHRYIDMEPGPGFEKVMPIQVNVKRPLLEKMGIVAVRTEDHK